MIYIFLILTCIILTVYASRYKFYINKHKRLFVFETLSVLLIVFIVGFREISVGTDTGGTYLRIYEKAYTNLGAIRDVGYGLLNYICYHIWDNYNFVLVVVSVIVYSLIFIRIYKNSKIPWLSVFLFFATDFFFISLNMTRQSISIAIFIYILPLIHSDIVRDKIKTMVWILIAISMHTTAVVIIPVCFVLRKIKLTPKKAIIITGLNVLFYEIINTVIIKLLLKSSYLKKYFAWYLDSSYNTGELSVFGLLIPFAICLYWMYVYYTENNCRSLEDINDLGVFMLISGNLMIYSDTIPLIGRLSMYFLLQVIILIPNSIICIRNKKNRIVLESIIILGYSLYMIITIFVQGQEGVLPYANILFGGKK